MTQTKNNSTRARNLALVPPPHERLCAMHGKPISPSAWLKGCRSGGCTLCRENGEWAGQVTTEEGRKGKRTNGIKSKEHLANVAHLGGTMACHVRWHSEKYSPKCLVCRGEVLYTAAKETKKQIMARQSHVLQELRAILKKVQGHS